MKEILTAAAIAFALVGGEYYRTHDDPIEVSAPIVRKGDRSYGSRERLPQPRYDQDSDNWTCGYDQIKDGNKYEWETLCWFDSKEWWKSR